MSRAGNEEGCAGPHCIDALYGSAGLIPNQVELYVRPVVSNIRRMHDFVRSFPM